MGNNQGQGHSIAAIIGLVLGILAVVSSWMPIINNLSFMVGALGVVFAVVGLVGVLRGKKAGRGLAIAAVVINIVALAIVLGTQSMYSAAVDEAVNGPDVAAVSQGESDADAAAGDDAASTTDLAPGASVELESGLSVTVDSVESVESSDGTLIKVGVTYVNNGDESADYNSYDWKGEDEGGAQEYGAYYMSPDFESDSDALSSGSLAAGGTVSGNLYFEQGTVRALYFASAIADEPAASWKLA